MEKEKKTTKKVATKTVAKKPVAKKAEPAKTVTKKAVKASKPAKAEKVATVAEQVKAEPVAEVKTEKVATPAVVKEQPKKMTFNQELNLLIGLFSLITIIAFCFAFQGGDVEILGWELFLRAGDYYSSVFQGVMILYVVSIFIDCILAIRIDCDKEIFNIIEKVLYMFTVIMNFVVLAILLSLISQVGIGLLIFFVISVVSAVVKFARIFAK